MKPNTFDIEPRHLTGSGGIGKGSQRRRGEDPEAYREGWDRVFGGRTKRRTNSPPDLSSGSSLGTILYGLPEEWILPALVDED